MYKCRPLGRQGGIVYLHVQKVRANAWQPCMEPLFPHVELPTVGNISWAGRRFEPTLSATMCSALLKTLCGLGLTTRPQPFFKRDCYHCIRDVRMNTLIQWWNLTGCIQLDCTLIQMYFYFPYFHKMHEKSIFLSHPNTQYANVIYFCTVNKFWTFNGWKVKI